MLLSADGKNEQQRLDNFLLGHLPGVPRARIYRAVRSGEVRVNGGRQEPGYRMKIGDRVRVPPLRVATRSGSATDISAVRMKCIRDSVLYEDRDILVLDKPSGLAVHGGSGIDLGLIETVRKTFSHAEGYELVHRLDRDTSGCLMIAKRRRALLELHRAFRESRIRKDYLCIVNGYWPADDGFVTVDLPLEHRVLRSGERLARIAAGGKPAITRYRRLRKFAGLSLVQVRPFTGRMHQIRVHAAAAGHPLLGDIKYGRTRGVSGKSMKVRKMFLHAQRLTIPGEKGKLLRVTAPLPEHFQTLLAEKGEHCPSVCR